jgi:very-short-patch-repair endonuclease
MGWLTPIALLLLICLLAWAARRLNRRVDSPAGRRRGPSGIRGVVPICSAGEMAFLDVLESVVPQGLRVLCKVRVADAIDTFGADFRTVSQKHFDFLICDAELLRPLLAIELDDRSHLTATQQARDAVKDAVCAQAGLTMLRVPAQAAYDRQVLARQIVVQLKGCNV